MLFTMLLPAAAWGVSIDYIVTVGHNVPDPVKADYDWGDNNNDVVANAYAKDKNGTESEPSEKVWETLSVASGDTVKLFTRNESLFYPYHLKEWQVLEGGIQPTYEEENEEGNTWGYYSFVMPEENVKLQAIFEPCHFEFLGEKDAENRIMLKDAKVDEAYADKIQVSTCWEKTYFELDEYSFLPYGLSLNRETGAIEGTPEEGGRFVFTVRAYPYSPEGEGPSVITDNAIIVNSNAQFAEGNMPVVASEGNRKEIPYEEQVYVLDVYDQIKIPLEKIVEKGGSYDPTQETFAFAVELPFQNDTDMKVKLENDTITSSGTGTFKGTMTLAANTRLEAILAEMGIKIREVQGNASHWTYSDKVYLARASWDQEWFLEFYDITNVPLPEGREWIYDLTGLASSDTVSFKNVYTRNGSSGGSSSSTYYRLNYESNGGTPYAMERYLNGKIVDLDKEPTREGYTFTGWYEDKNLKTEITSVKMTSDKTVFAGWKEKDGKVPEALNGEEHFSYIVGYEDGMVRPTRNITRAEAASIIYRLLKEDVRKDNMAIVNNFTDVNAGTWYNTAISTIAAMKIMDGRTATTFEPNAPITRAELASAFARFDMTKPDQEASFSDITGHKMESDIRQAAALGWVKGYEDGTFRPDALITRAETVTLINTVLQRMPQDTDSLLKGMITWPDNMDTKAWYYLAIQEAGNSHEYEKHGKYEDWTRLIK
jgi:uncharacterized repeat protein (TIGR02543 family)